MVARQRPGTAKGIVFLLLEDEHGMANVIVQPEVYERDRIAVRAEPLLEVTGRLERREGTINVLAERVPLRDPGGPRSVPRRPSHRTSASCGRPRPSRTASGAVVRFARGASGAIRGCSCPSADGVAIRGQTPFAVKPAACQMRHDRTRSQVAKIGVRPRS